MSKNYLINCYKQHFKEILLPLNFVLKGKYFYRVVNGEIIQAIGIQKNRLRRAFTITINFKPFCMGFDVRDLVINGERLSNLLYGDDIWWDFDENNTNFIEYQINHVANEFKKILYLFEEIVDTKSYYEMVSRHKKIIFGNDLYGNMMVYVYLKLKMYNEALLTIEKVKSDINEWANNQLEYQQLDLNKSINKEEEMKKLIIKIKEDLNFLEYENIRDAILRGDHFFINEMIKKNGDISKQSCRDHLKIVL